MLPDSVAAVDPDPELDLRAEGTREIWASFLLYFVGFLVVGSLAAALWLAISGTPSGGTPDVPTTAASLVGAYGAILGGLALVHGASRRSGGGDSKFRDHYRFRAGSASLLAAGVFVGVASQIGIGILQTALRHVDEAIQPSETSLDIATKAKGDGTVSVAVLFVAFAVLAPVVEELFFRGLFLGAIRKRFGSAVAIALSSIVFGLVHVNGFDKAGVFTGGALALFGLALALLVERYRVLGPAIAAHVAFNVFSLVLLFR